VWEVRSDQAVEQFNSAMNAVLEKARHHKDCVAPPKFKQRFEAIFDLLTELNVLSCEALEWWPGSDEEEYNPCEPI